MSVALILLLRILLKYKKLSLLLAEYAEAEDSIPSGIYNEVFGTWANKPKVLRIPEFYSPMSCGVLHKRILLPPCNYSSDEIRCILLHEASHIKNRDPLLQLLTNILCAVYWWNPLVYLLRTDMWHAFELRCDRDVIKSIGYDQITIYLKTLVSVLENTDNNNLQNQVTGVLGLNRDLKLIKERVDKSILEKIDVDDLLIFRYFSICVQYFQYR